MFGALGRFTYHRRRPIVVVWALLAVASALFASQVNHVLRPGGFELESLEAMQTRTLLLDELNTPPAQFQIVYGSDVWTVDDPRFQQALGDSIERVRRVSNVIGVSSILDTFNPRLVSQDRSKTWVLVDLDLGNDEAQEVAPIVKAAAQTPGLTLHITGLAVIYADIDLVSARDLERAEQITFPLALVALIVAFGSVIAAGIPVAIGGVTVVITLGILYFVAQQMDMSIFVLNTATLLGLGVGIDYSLFMVARFREEIDRSPVAQAVEKTVATAGRAVLFSGFTVALGLGGLLTFDFMLLKSVGVGGMLVVSVAVLASLSLMPALFAILGSRINRLSIRRGRSGPEGPGRFWPAIAERVMRFPVPIFGVTLVFLLLLAAPFLSVRLGAPDARILPADIESRQAYDLLQSEFPPGETTPIFVALRSDGGSPLAPDRIASLYDYTREMAGDPRVSRVDSIVDLDPRLTAAQYQLLYSRPDLLPRNGIAQVVEASTSDDLVLLSVVTPFLTISVESQGLIDDIRGRAPPAGFSTVRVTGPSAGIKDVVDELYRELPRALLFILATTTLALLVLFRSIVVPLKAILLNTLSIGASFGALVFIFQEGNFSDLLNFEPLGYVDAFIPIILVCILFGLSMDYEVFLLSRIKENYDRSGDNRESVKLGLQQTGRVITSAAFILVAVAGSFALTDIVLIKALGLGIAIAIFVDATFVRILLVPSTMRLLGDWNWWAPARLQRALDRLGLER